MDCKQVRLTNHARRRMFERWLSVEGIEMVLRRGEVIAEYPDDKPYPSSLLLGFVEGMPLHVVVAKEPPENCIVVTVYVTEPHVWNADWKTRKGVT